MQGSQFENTKYGIIDKFNGRWNTYNKVNYVPALLTGIHVQDEDTLEYYRLNITTVDITYFGARANDLTFDSSLAFNKAIDYANSLNVAIVDASGVNGVTITVPDGIYMLSQPLNPVLRSGVCIRGSSKHGSALFIKHSGNVFDFGGTTGYGVGGEVSDLKIEYDPTITTGVIFYISNYERLSLSRLSLVNVKTFAVLGSAADRKAGDIVLHDVRGYVSNHGNPFLKVNYGAGLDISQISVFVGGVAAPALNRTSNMATVDGTHAIYVGGSAGNFWDTVIINNSQFWGFTSALLCIAPAGTVLQTFYVSNTIFDYIAGTAIHFQTDTLSGAVTNAYFANCWFAAWGGNTVTFAGIGLKKSIQFTNCLFVSAGQHSILVNEGTTKLTVSNCEIQGSNRKDVNANGITLLPGCSKVKIVDTNIGGLTNWGEASWQPVYGLYSEDPIDNLRVIDSDFEGSAGGAYLPDVSGTSIITGNTPEIINVPKKVLGLPAVADGEFTTLAQVAQMISDAITTT